MRYVSYLFLLIIVIFGMTFATLNSESVTIDYYIDQSSMPLSLLLVIVFALGCMTGMFASIWLLIKAKIINYRLRHQISNIEKEVELMKGVPDRGKS